ncbi:ATP-grasp domain-containing protein [Sulfurimonas sp. SAG-AH-194-I05]|nr:ATP-grasp domain-containing protein [Sulfurimonas sp. SAG-AH-194-I05]MDF1874436.1 ATP-grasp domain-containing protein [Sulfurimonas sp. SAG-AH-194-I05]
MAIIGITGTGSLVGQAIIKSIKESSFKEEKFIGMEYFENTIGSYWTDENYILPDILDDKVSDIMWLNAVLSIINDKQIEILFIGVDFELPLFATYKERIENETQCLVVVSSEETIRIADDKYLTYEFLKKNNLYFPLSFLESNIKEAIRNKEITFPMIVKPRNGYRSVDVFLVKDENELFEKIEKVSDPVIQEYVGDSSTEYTCGVIAFDSKVKESIVLRRDLKDGNTSTTYLKHDYPVSIKKYIEEVSSHLGQFGVCNFQLRLDAQGIPKIFEINARHSGTTYIRSLYGFNEIEYILEYLLNKKEISFTIKEGIVKRYFDAFLVEES